MFEVGWPSLHPLRHLKQLEDLILHAARDTPPFAFSLDHLVALVSLRTLKLESLHPSLDEAMVASLQPPSVRLVSFRYSPPRRRLN
jgi:hypothetical protein